MTDLDLGYAGIQAEGAETRRTYAAVPQVDERARPVELPGENGGLMKAVRLFNLSCAADGQGRPLTGMAAVSSRMSTGMLPLVR